jgi:geranylgeranyl pyrophosphate synthase
VGHVVELIIEVIHHEGVPPWDTPTDLTLSVHRPWSPELLSCEDSHLKGVFLAHEALKHRDGNEGSFYVNDLEKLTKLVNSGLVAFCEQLDDSSPFKAYFEYLCSTGGKRLRPLLLLALQLDLNPDSPVNIDIMTAVELLHQASLLHDDLPALDDDDVRRGYPTIHVKFTEHEAILLGDWLYGKAIYLVIFAQLDSKVVVRVAGELSNLWCDICEGQELDMRNPQYLDSLRTVRFLKTSSFFEKIARISGFLASQDAEVSYSISRWGRDLGDLFQEVDDLLDRERQLALKGRPYSSDIKNQKGSLGIQYLSIKECRELKEELSSRLLSIHDSDFKRTRDVLNLAFKSLETM